MRSAKGNVATVTDPTSNADTNNYTSQGWLNTHTQSGGGNQASTSYTRDVLGRVTRETDGASRYIDFAYNTAGDLTTRTDGLSHATTFTYDNLHRLLTQTDALNHTTTFTWDKKGNKLTETDALSRTTTYVYDAQDRVKEIIDARGVHTYFAYDLAGRFSSVTDGNSNVTSYTYDNANRLTVTTDPRNSTTTYVYDNANRRTQITDRDGRVRQFVYDNANRQTDEKWLDGGGATIRTITYTYDNADRMIGATDPSSTYTYAYDGSNRLTSVDNNGTPSMPRVILTYTYDYRDNVLTVSDNSSGVETYTWDGANNLTSAGFVVTGLSKKPKVEISYDNASRLSVLTRKDAGASGGGASGGATLNTDFTFDNADRLTGMNHKYNGTSIRNYTWAFNNANELTQEVSYDGTENYTYDTGSQLTGATGWRAETYSFDNTGNRTMTGYSTGTGNRMTSDGVFNYTYDNEGNMTKKTRISNGEYTDYFWDYRNRLTKVEKRNSGGTLLDKSEYVYDLFDKRIATIVGVSSPVTTWTAYDGGNPYADFNGAGSLTSRYLAGRQLDQFFGRFDASNSLIWYLTDHLGSVRDVANNSGTVLDHIKYDSFGGIVSESSPSNGDRFKFTGREYDAATGLYYYRARYYDPATGRFLAEDPLSFDGGDANLFRYVENAPTQFIDPTGRAFVIPAAYAAYYAAAGAGMIAGAAYAAVYAKNAPEALGYIAIGGLAGVSLYQGGVLISRLFIPSTIGEAGAAAAAGMGIGTRAVLPHNYPTNQLARWWPAVMKDGKVYVHHMHSEATKMANSGVIGPTDAYGMARTNSQGVITEVIWGM